MTDQGLLYYWVKYVKQKVSIIIGDNIEHWIQSSKGGSSNKPKLESFDTSRDLSKKYSCSNNYKGEAPYKDFKHLSGRMKPWKDDITELNKILKEYQRNPSKPLYSRHQWYYLLVQMKKELEEDQTARNISSTDRLEITLDFINDKDTPAVGLAPSYIQMATYLYVKKRNGWRQYEYEKIEAGNKTAHVELISKAEIQDQLSQNGYSRGKKTPFEIGVNASSRSSVSAVTEQLRRNEQRVKLLEDHFRA
jgi:hypothetical protein